MLLFFGQIRPAADSGWAIVGHGGSPSSNLVILAYFNANSIALEHALSGVRPPSVVR